MRTLLTIIILVTLVSCSSQTKTTKLKSELGNGVVKNSVDLSEKYVGFWVYEKYFEALQKTKSTKIAGEMDVDDFFRISKDNSIMRMNIHEGYSYNIVVMSSTDKGQIFSSDTAELYFNVEFKDETMIVDGKQYIKAPNGENGLNELVNSAFISGEYTLDGTQVEFKANGTIQGLDSVLSYELNLDYKDAGMQLDKIYLKCTNTENPVPYTYQMKEDTLFISEIDCKTFEDDFCVEIEKGKVVYTLLKK